MSTSLEKISSRRQRQIDKLLRDTLWDIVRTPKAQRNLVLIALIAPAVLALGYITYFGGTFFLVLGIACALVIAVSGTLLQKSVRKITVLPDHYLDERQIVLRNRAFRVAYRRLSKAGFGIWIIGFAFVFTSRLGVFTDLRYWVDKNSGTLLANGHETQNFTQWLVYWTWSQLERSVSNAWGGYFLVTILIWYVWITPIAIIAWNEARQGGGVKPD